MFGNGSTKRVRLVALAAAGAMALSLGACGGGGSDGGTGGSGKASIVWSTWGTPEELTRVQQFTDQFNKDHPDISVKLQPVADYSDYHSKLLAQLTSNTAPDVFYVGDDNIGQFVASGRLAPLKEKMNSAQSKTKVDDFFPGLFSAAEKDGEYYAAPNDDNPDVMWYDKEALKAAGITEDPAELAAKDQWTVTAFTDMTAKLKKAGLTGAMFWNYWSTHYSWISANGGKAYDESGAFVANTDPTSVAAIDQLGKLFQDGEFVAADVLPEGAGADSVFVTHKSGFLVQGRYTIGTVKAAGVQDSYDIVRWPTKDGKAAPTGVAASYLAINKDSKHVDAAFQFWTAFLSAEGQKFRLSEGGNAVPSIKGADDVVLAGNYPAHAQTFLDMRDIGFAMPAAEARVPKLSTDISDLMLKRYQGKASAQDTLDQAAALVAKGSAG